MALMSIKNLTIAVKDDFQFIKIDKKLNKIIGSSGKEWDRLLVHKNKRECILKSIKSVDDGASIGNSSFLYLAKNDLADIYFGPYSMRIDKNYLETTKVVTIKEYQLGQFLIKPTKFQQTDLSNFLFDNINLLLYILIGYIIIILSKFLFTKFTNYRKIEISKNKFYNSLISNDNQLKFLQFELSLLELFLNVFLFINITLLTNTIKTDKVIVKTEQFLNTDEKLMATEKKFLFHMNNRDNYRLSPKNSLLYKLYEKKVNLENNYFDYSDTLDERSKKEFNLLSKKLSSFFLIGDKISKLFALSLFSLYTKGNEFVYLNDQNYFEFPNTHYLRKSLNEEIKKKINWSTNQYFENGIYIELETKAFNGFYKSINERDIPIVFDINQYIDEQSITSTFELENFRTIFYYYILILFMIWLILFIIRMILIVKFIYE